MLTSELTIYNGILQGRRFVESAPSESRGHCNRINLAFGLHCDSGHRLATITFSASLHRLLFPPKIANKCNSIFRTWTCKHELGFRAGLPDGIFTIQKSLFGFILRGLVGESFEMTRRYILGSLTIVQKYVF
jgi:hypothetical protein